MDEEKALKDFKALNQENKDIWNMNAEFWDKRMGDEGNDFHRILIEPTQECLLELKPGELVLDIACGNGQFTRRMAKLGAKVVALDFCERFIERAKVRTKEHVERIEYKVIDVTDKDQLATLGRKQFDAAVCTMAFMDMATIKPLISTLPLLLKSDGRFVFSIMHPCFNSAAIKQVVEIEDRDGEIFKVYYVKVSEYIHPSAKKGLGIIGQPVAHYYFHRPISTIFNACFRNGFVLDGIEEPTFEKPLDESKPWSWSQCNEIPPVLVACMRLLKSQKKRE